MATGGGKVGRLFIELSGDTNPLRKSLKEAEEAAASAGLKMQNAGRSALVAFDAALNPTLRLREQVQLLEAAGKSGQDIWKVYGDRLSTAAEAAKKNGQAIDPLIQKHLDLNKQTLTSKISFESLGNTITDFAHNPLEAAKGGISSFLGMLGPTAIGIGAVGAGVIAAGYAIYEFADNASEAAEQVKNLSYSTGMTVERVQALQRIGKEKGLSDLAGSIERINMQLGKGQGGTFTEALLKADISPKAGADALYYLEELRQKYLQIPDATERAQKATSDLGRRLVDLLPLILNDKESIKDMVGELEKTNTVMSGVKIDKLLELRKEIEEHGRLWEAAKNEAKGYAGEITLSVMKAFESLASNKAFQIWANAYASGAKWFGSLVGIGSRGDNDWEGSYGSVPKQSSNNQSETGKTSASVNEYQKRINEIAASDAIAAGTARDLIGLTTKLNALEKQYSEEKKNANGIDGSYSKSKLDSLAAQIASQKSLIDITKAASEALGSQGFGQFSNPSGFKAFADSIPISQVELDLRMEQFDTDFQSMIGTTIANANIQFEQNFLDPEYLENHIKETLKGLEGINAEATAVIQAEIDEFSRKSEEAWKASEEAWKAEEKRGQETVKTIQGFAGHIWDDLTSNSKDKWGDLLKDIENMFLNPLKKLFESLISSLLVGSNGSGGLLGGLIKSITGSGNSGGGLLSTITNALGLGSGSSGSSSGSLLGTITNALGLSGSSGASVADLSTASSLISGSGAVAVESLGDTSAVTAAIGESAMSTGATAAVEGGTAGGTAAATSASSLSGVGSALVTAAPYVAAAAVLAFGGYELAKLAEGKNSYEAMKDEIGRDMGVSMSTSQIKAFTDSMGIKEGTAWKERMQIYSSPAFVQYEIGLGKTPKANKYYPEMQAGIDEAKKTGNYATLNAWFQNYLGTKDGSKLDSGTASALMASNVPYENSLKRNVLSSYGDGTDFVPQTGIYELHRGERVETAEENKRPRSVTVLGGDNHFSFSISGNQDPNSLVQVVKSKIIPMIKDEIDKGNTGLRESVVRSVRITQGAY